MIEPLEIKEFSSERSFHFRDISWSGNGLTLHSFGSIFTGDAMDLIFLSTDYIELPFQINGLKITQTCDDLAVEYQDRFANYRNPDSPKGKSVFVIESEGNRFHVIAGKLWILERTHNLQSSLNILSGDNEIERKEFVENHIKRWFKITSY